MAALNMATTAAMIAARSAAGAEPPEPAEAAGAEAPMPRAGVVLIVAAFVALQAADSAVVSIMGLFVTETLGLDVMWAGIALGVRRRARAPALPLIARLDPRFSSLGLLGWGCVVGIAYYAAMAVSGPVLLVAPQVLNAWFFAVVAGVGLTLLQEIIPRPGLASASTRTRGASGGEAA